MHLFISDCENPRKFGQFKDNFVSVRQLAHQIACQLNCKNR